MSTADGVSPSVADKVADKVTEHASASRVLARFFLLVSLLAVAVACLLGVADAMSAAEKLQHA